jgi:hypothetical protein
LSLSPLVFLLFFLSISLLLLLFFFFFFFSSSSSSCFCLSFFLAYVFLSVSFSLFLLLQHNLIGNETYKCVVDAFGVRIGHRATLDRLAKLYPSMTDCKVSLQSPQHVFWIFENYGGGQGTGLTEIFFCRQVG